ncbi:ABC transporter substrate-binding protein [Paenibacillus sacheonensis]|uniref:Extracellular solute-binding protein n=1 Tax=Paenibacillus sacheonensis TaxID=742054 RepID=A0A7X4YM25_9BACL|nr:ABC transporter substrate-binding protein [Paenibacillus sacheonensis]MBM7565810.1 putative aldouronate transport system substrate-binding protein [Paenibacillus sacheonensis]NBC68870.1 extracellular solute-binding protein [Paenibacillus sacheonensis]
MNNRKAGKFRDKVLSRRLKWIAVLSLAACLTFAAAGCTKSQQADGDGGADLDELIWYYPQNKANADLQLVNDEVNRLIADKVHARVKLQPVDFANYEQKLNTLVAASDPMDIVWTSNWLFPWDANARKGVFQPLDELLERDGQKLKASMSPRFWNDGKQDGKQLAVPNYQIAATRPSLIIQKRFVDKYKLDLGAIRKIDDIEPFLKQLKEGEPGIVPFGTTRGFYTNHIYGIDWRATVYRNDAAYRVLPDVTPEMKQNFALVHAWYDKGYINQDAATLNNVSDVYNKGNTAVWFDFTGKPGSEAEFKAGDGGFDVVLVPLAKPSFTGAASSMNAISRTSKHPDKAMRLLELVNTDKQLYNTLVYGIEGKHYTRLDGNYVRLNPDAGYFTNTDWVFGNIRNEYLPEGAPADKIEQTVRINDEAEVSPYYDFVFRTDDLKAELANVKAVNDEYYAALATGTIDPAKYLPIYEEKLNKAGSERIRAEKQKQLDEWVEAKGKK